MADLLAKYNRQFSLNVNTIASITDNLPPTSAQSFLRENITFPAVILNSKPLNRYYHSIYDDNFNINYTYYNTTEDFTILPALTDIGNFPHDSIQVAIRNVSTTIAFTLYEMVTGTAYTGDKAGNAALVSTHSYVKGI